MHHTANLAEPHDSILIPITLHGKESLDIDSHDRDSWKTTLDKVFMI